MTLRRIVGICDSGSTLKLKWRHDWWNKKDRKRQDLGDWLKLLREFDKVSHRLNLCLDEMGAEYVAARKVGSKNIYFSYRFLELIYWIHTSIKVARAAFFNANGAGSAEQGCNFVSRTLTTLIKKIKETSSEIMTGTVRIHRYWLSFIQQLKVVKVISQLQTTKQ